MLTYLIGYDPKRPVPFGEDDPEGEFWLERARQRGKQALEVRRVLPNEERVDVNRLVDNELADWWGS